MWSRRAKKQITNVEKDNHDQTPPSSSRENELQIVSVSPPPFKLPDDWLVEKRPRRGPNPDHRVDRYYYEPKTRRKFRSLIAVQRYLQEEARDYERIVSENIDNAISALSCRYCSSRAHSRVNTSCVIRLPNERIVKEKPCNNANICYLGNYIESGTGQQSRPVRAYEGCLTGGNACTATPKLMLKFGNGKQSAHGVRNFQNPVKKCFSVGEDKTTSEASKSKHSKKADSQKKVNFGEEETVHNLTRPPAKVRWVLSGSGGYWRPFLDDSIVPESEKLKWSEAFVQSIHEGYG